MFKLMIVIVSFLLAALSNEVLAQSKLIKMADEHYRKLEYKDAAKMYEIVLEKSGDFIYHIKLAQCYEKLNDPVKVEYWYKRASKQMPLKSIDKYNLAMALTKNKKYDEAIYWFEIYNQEKPEDRRAVNYIKGLSNIENFYRQSHQYKIRNHPTNTQRSDFSPTYFKGGLVFVSARAGLDKLSLNENLHTWDYTPFLDLYYYNKGERSVEGFSKKVNSTFHEGPVSFYNSEQSIFFTRNNFFEGKTGTDTDGIVKLKLYSAHWSNGKWTRLKAFKYNNENYSVGHPSISEDGQRLFFVSDMPGGFGGTDIYYTYKDERGNWVEPVNLGKNVNTSGNEMFPFLHTDNMLYFASDGLGGLGGLDIFEAHFNNNEALWVKNLGSPINSSADDFGLIMDASKINGYFSSNRAGGKGKDDIYSIKMFKNDIKIKGIVVDKNTKKPLPGVRIKVMDGDLETDYLITHADGTFELSVEPEKMYRMIFKKIEYLTLKDTLNTRALKFGTSIKLQMEMEAAPFIVNAVAIRKQNQLPILDQKVNITLRNETLGKTRSLVSDSDGEVQMKLEPESDYILKAEKPNHFTLSQRFTTHGLEEPTTFQLQLPMQEIVMDKPIKIENIYYDFNKWNLRQDARIEVDKLYQLLADNPTIKIELSSHTDSRGDAKYNLELSQKRAESVVNYLVSNGISAERLAARGYGESRLLNYCSGFVQCSDEDHQVNRRTEFKVIGNIRIKKYN